MLLSTELALRRRLGVIHEMVDRFEGAQIGKNRRQVIIRHVLVDWPGHGKFDAASLDASSPHGFDEERLIVIRNSRRIRRDVRAGYLVKRGTACERKSCNGMRRHPFLGRVTFRATSDSDQVLSAFNRARSIRRNHRRCDWLRQTLYHVLQPKGENALGQRVVDRFKGTQINHYRSQIFIGKLPKVVVAHDGEEGASVPGDTLADRARQRVVAPGSDTGRWIRRDVGSDHAVFPLLQEYSPYSLLRGNGGRIGFFVKLR